jgi:hypothetical protein
MSSPANFLIGPSMYLVAAKPRMTVHMISRARVYGFPMNNLWYGRRASRKTLGAISPLELTLIDLERRDEMLRHRPVYHGH